MLLSAQLLVASALLLVILTIIQASVNRHVPQAYMDEPFHVPQTQQYCKGNFYDWDPKITTLPGLYFLGVAYAAALGALTPGAALHQFCTTQHLRTLNVLLSLACFRLLYHIHNTLHGTPGKPKKSGNSGEPGESGTSRNLTSLLVAVALTSYPLHFFYSFLYYTDVGSAVFLLLCYALALRQRHLASAAAGSVAVMFRQTNAVWVTFILAIRILDYLDTHTPHTYSSNTHTSHTYTSPTPPQASSHTTHTRTPATRTPPLPPVPPSLSFELSSLLHSLWRHRATLLLRFWPLLLIPLAFTAFVLTNGGITVGDKQAHQPVKHLMQLQYFALYTAAMAAPVFLGAGSVLDLVGDVRRWVRGRPVLTVLGMGGAAAVSAVVVWKCSLVHPYLEADNRHYTFYIWRKWFAKGLLYRCALVPGYVYSWYVILKALRARCSRVWVAGYLLCCAATLVPAWLLEFRYFTVPYMLLLLHMKPPTRTQLVAMITVNVAVNAFTLYMFMYRPYRWADGSTARFMW